MIKTRLEILSRPKVPKILTKLLGNSKKLKGFKRILTAKEQADHSYPKDPKEIQSAQVPGCGKDSKEFQRNTAVQVLD